MNYYKKEWLSKYKETFNYCALIDDTKKLKNNFINKKGNKESAKNII